MAEKRKEETPNGLDAYDLSNVESIFGRAKGTSPQARLTAAEVAQYRVLLPRLLHAVEALERLTGPSGCPAARAVLDLDD